LLWILAGLLLYGSGNGTAGMIFKKASLDSASILFSPARDIVWNS